MQVKDIYIGKKVWAIDGGKAVQKEITTIARIVDHVEVGFRENHLLSNLDVICNITDIYETKEQLIASL